MGSAGALVVSREAAAAGGPAAGGVGPGALGQVLDDDNTRRAEATQNDPHEKWKRTPSKGFRGLRCSILQWYRLYAEGWFCLLVLGKSLHPKAPKPE